MFVLVDDFLRFSLDQPFDQCLDVLDDILFAIAIVPKHLQFAICNSGRNRLIAVKRIRDSAVQVVVLRALLATIEQLLKIEPRRDSLAKVVPSTESFLRAKLLLVHVRIDLKVVINFLEVITGLGTFDSAH